MRAGIETNFRGFTAVADSGALLGPWNSWLHEPHVGKPIRELTKAMSQLPKLPRPVRGGVLSEPGYRRMVTAFDQHGAAELIYLVELYCLVSAMLNGLDVPVPEEAPAA